MAQDVPSVIVGEVGFVDPVGDLIVFAIVYKLLLLFMQERPDHRDAHEQRPCGKAEMVVETAVLFLQEIGLEMIV